MTSQEAQISSKFPENFGDFRIKSSDGIICYFPSALLGFMSPVFQDMLNLGMEGSQNTESSKPVVEITEKGKILELFLVHLNPKMRKPEIEKETVGELLEMAHKYQTDTIMEWFEDQSTSQQTSMGVTGKEPFAVTEPILTLSLACRYELRAATRYAMEEVYKVNTQSLLDNAPQLGLDAFIKLWRMRETRIKFYQEFIKVLSQKRDGWEKDTNSDRGLEFWVNNRWQKACTSCIAGRSEWIFGIMQAVQTEPSWDSFMSAYEQNSKCCFAWSDFFRASVPGWEAVALEVESKVLE